MKKITNWKRKKEITAIDVELSYVASSGIAYYRLTREMKEFLDRCHKKHGIVGFEYEKGSFNFGVILKDKS